MNYNEVCESKIAFGHLICFPLGVVWIAEV